MAGGDDFRVIAEHACFGGVQGFYSHASTLCRAPMRFSVYRPPQASSRRVPVLYYLAGLTCTEETFMVKAGAQRVAAELGLMLVAPDTSPRVRLPGDDAHWDFGLGAGFYVDATFAPWSKHYHLYSWVTQELPALVAQRFPASDAQGIFGHSMGGHGALVCAMRNPDRYRSVSAFAPIAAPSQCPWGQKAFGGYLGEDRAEWAQYDATELAARRGFGTTILVDQGTADEYLSLQLLPDRLVEACRASGTPIRLNLREGYGHGYWFVQTFVEDHLRHHAALLGGQS